MTVRHRRTVPISPQAIHGERPILAMAVCLYQGLLMPAHHVLYRESQGRILSLVNTSNANQPVEACPGWTVRDTIAHLLGVLTDFSAGKLEEASADSWSDGHIERVRNRTLADISTEWHVRANTTPGVFQKLGAVLVADLVTHEFDIKQALGNVQGRDLPVVRTTALFYLEALDAVWRQEGIPPLRILTESNHLDIGGENPATSVEMSWWEIGRVVSGRRSIDQVKHLTWSGDASPWLDHLFAFGPRETDLNE